MSKLPKPDPARPVIKINGRFYQDYPAAVPGLGGGRTVEVQKPASWGANTTTTRPAQQAQAPARGATNQAQFEATQRAVDNSVYQVIEIIRGVAGNQLAEAYRKFTEGRTTAQRAALVQQAVKDFGIPTWKNRVGLAANPKGSSLTPTQVQIFDLDIAKNVRALAPRKDELLAKFSGATSARTDVSPISIDELMGTIPGGGGGSGSFRMPGAGAPLAQKKNFTDAELRQFVREAYGMYAAFLDMPEVGPVLLQAAREGWSAQRLMGALGETNWWKATSEAQRTWDAEELTDQASTRAKIDARMADVRVMAQNVGVAFDETAMSGIVRASLRNGMTDMQLREALAAEAEKNPVTAQTVRQTSAATGLRKIANDYAVRLSDEAISQWASRIGFGVDNEDNFKEYVKEFAKSAYQSIAPDLDRGMTVRQWMDPYLQMAGSLLEMDPSTIDLTDAKWLAVLQQPAETFAPTVGRRTTPRVDTSTSNTQTPAGTPLLPGQMQAPPATQGVPANVGNSPAQGGFQPMTLARWAQELRTNERYGWDNTNNAKAEARQLADQLAKAFGKKG